jgi:hypothetical protein
MEPTVRMSFLNKLVKASAFSHFLSKFYWTVKIIYYRNIKKIFTENIKAYQNIMNVYFRQPDKKLWEMVVSCTEVIKSLIYYNYFMNKCSSW